MKPPATQHDFAKKVCEALAKHHIPIKGYDRLGNPFVLSELVPKLPHSLKADLQKNGCHRVIIRSNPHEQ